MNEKKSRHKLYKNSTPSTSLVGAFLTFFEKFENLKMEIFYKSLILLNNSKDNLLQKGSYQTLVMIILIDFF
jgi:hypothetical protein